MQSSFLILCILGYALCLKFPDQINAKILRLLSPPKELCHDFYQVLFISQILGSLRSGISLDNALEEISQNPNMAGFIRTSAKKILDGEPEKGFLSSLLYSSLTHGASCSQALGTIQKILRVKIKMKQKIDAIASQAKAQAEVLSWMPCLLAAAIYLLDSDWFHTAMRNSLSWLLWSLSLASIGLGKIWFHFLIQRALNPENSLEILLEHHVPDLLIRIISEITMGVDAQSALEKSLNQIALPNLSSFFAANKHCPESILHLKSILQQSSRGGSGIRDELLALLQDLYAAQESKWEEKAQKIPIQLMAPLFGCFFPGTILILLGLLLPSIQGAL